MAFVVQAVIAEQEEINDDQFVGKIALFTEDGTPFDLSAILQEIEDLKTRVTALEDG
jgi:hypothetical protein